MRKHKQGANEVNAKEITEAVKRDEQAEFATEFPQQQTEKGMNKRGQRQKKQ